MADQDWFAANAPGAGDWFADNAPRAAYPEPPRPRVPMVRASQGALDNYADKKTGLVDKAADAYVGLSHLTNDAGNAYVSSLANNFDPRGLIHTVRHPVTAIQQLVDAKTAKAKEAADAFSRGDYGRAALSAAETLPEGGDGIQATEDAVNKVHKEGLVGAAGVAGDLTGKVAPMALSELSVKIPGLQSTLNPTEQAAIDSVQSQRVPPPAPAGVVETPGEKLLRLSKSEPVALDAGTVTGNQAVKGAQALLSKTPLSASLAATERGRQGEQLSQLGQKLAERAAPTPQNFESAGNGINDAIESRAARVNAVANKQYDRVRDISNQPQNVAPVQVGNVKPAVDLPAGYKQLPPGPPIFQDMAMPVNLSGVKQELAPLVSRIEAQVQAAQRQASPGYLALRQIMDRPNMIDLDTANSDLSAVLSIGRKGIPGMREIPQVNSISQGIAKTVGSKLRGAIDTAASADPRVEQALGSGRAATITKYDAVDLLSKFPQEPNALAQKLTAGKDIHADLLQHVAQVAPQQTQAMGRAFIEGLLDQATKEGGFTKTKPIYEQWNKLGPRTKAALFPDADLRSDLDNYFHASKMWGENVNPSGTASVAQLMATGAMMLHNPVTGMAYLVGARQLTKALFSPGGAKMIMAGASVPVGAAMAKPLYAAIIGNITAGQQRVPQVSPIAQQPQPIGPASIYGPTQ